MAPTNPCSHLLVTVLSLLTIISISTSLPTSQSDDPLLKILHTSLTQLSTTISTTTNLHRRINEPKQQAELEDCLQLLDLSRDRVLSSVRAITKSAHTDARTWLSAVLTNYDTCLDGLNGYVKLSMETQLKSLMKSTSATLALLATSDNDDVITQVVELPSWISKRDRKLLEARTPKDVQANVVVAKDGSGKFTTVQEALNSVPDNGNTRYVIYVKKGVYQETVRLEKQKKNVMIVGDGMNATVITGSLNFVDGTTTFNSATLAAVGDGLILQDLKIENTAGAIKHQAVALRVGADRSVINRCNIEGYQDTLYTHSLRQFYRDSIISGTVDFIFGDAAVVFQNCKLVARRPLDNQQNLVTAQGRIDPNQNTGISIQNCQIIPSSDLKQAAGAIKSYLGRPWKEYSRTVFMQSYIDSHIDPKGWLEWDGQFALTTLFYGEYMNKGPGAGTGGRVNWPGYHVITDANVAKSYTVAGLIQGGTWLKDTGVAFTEGL
ncbi:Pectinesterase protein [Dioscorea alata]|uniref:Pectinesterase protein n=1 Tax=Dioscorea alata TaxID=55571 RepID=A0ACB7UP03_DIOAL|nr:Pectinesterase protein [Dioscorea alata]